MVIGVVVVVAVVVVVVVAAAAVARSSSRTDKRPWPSTIATMTKTGMFPTTAAIGGTELRPEVLFLEDVLHDMLF